MADDYLKLCKQFIKEEKYREAFAQLRLAQVNDDFARLHRHARLFKSIPKNSLELTPIKIAMVATSTVDHFVDIFRFWLSLQGFAAEIYVTEFNTMDQAILNPASELYTFQPDIVWIFTNSRDIHIDLVYGSSQEGVETCLQENVERFKTLWTTLKQHSSAYIIQNNAEIPLERVFGNYEGSVAWGKINILRQFNVQLAQAILPGVTVFDMDYVSSVYGKRTWFDERYWYHSKHAFAFDAVGLVASEAARLVSAIKGRAKKCLVLDLDNTLWGGIIGDDGLEGIVLGDGANGEAYVDFQKYLKRLKDRGVILTVCSKNDESNAKSAFLEHPEMVLKLEDIALFTANWKNKVDNIQDIAATLDIGLESMVFVDDNPAERDLVKKYLPMVSVPDMPEDPSWFMRTLDAQQYFETVTFSGEDQKRSDMYRDNLERKTLQTQYTDLTDYLKSLQMCATVSPFDAMYQSRIAQLLNKSNQFHLTTTRYTEAQIKDMMADENIIGRYFKLKDRFGDNGLISVVILQKQNEHDLFIDTWLMSCRVLARGMEDFVQNEIVAIAKKHHCQRILGQYIPTKKNQLVADHYKKFGYIMTEENQGTTLWALDITNDVPSRETFIENESKELV